MAAVTENLGLVTAYGYALSKGYSGTEEEFAEMMAGVREYYLGSQEYAEQTEDLKEQCEEYAERASMYSDAALCIGYVEIRDGCLYFIKADQFDGDISIVNGELIVQIGGNE